MDNVKVVSKKKLNKRRYEVEWLIRSRKKTFETFGVRHARHSCQAEVRRDPLLSRFTLTDGRTYIHRVEYSLVLRKIDSLVSCVNSNIISVSCVDSNSCSIRAVECTNA
jgi:hypothetical protein